jgi:hypothetical protein
MAFLWIAHKLNLNNSKFFVCFSDMPPYGESMRCVEERYRAVNTSRR